MSIIAHIDAQVDAPGPVKMIVVDNDSDAIMAKHVELDHG
jgi:hypothetical protein